MYRLYGAFGVLAVILVLITTGFIINTKTANEASVGIERAAAEAKNGSIPRATETIRKTRERWSKKMEIMLLFDSHGRVDDIEKSLLLAESYIENHELHHFLAECSVAKLMTDHFLGFEYPELNNIF